MKISQFFSRILFRKTIAAALVMMILVSQTIHVDFFDVVEAGPENYRDIVSIIIDRDTYGAERNRVLRYATDIAGYLGGVRTSILVVEPDTPVAVIAAKNEKLYYEGDGEKGTSALVGTVLIGNIPIANVEKNGTQFPSLYPYVDFTDKVFVYDPKSARYVYNNAEAGAEAADIWHGVINPAVGRAWSSTTDVSKIAQFLDKTHEFYTKSGKFAPSPIAPKIFYYDGFSESKSIDARALFQYSLSIENAENIAYNRYTKYLLEDVSHALKLFDMGNVDADTASTYTSLGLPPGDDTLSAEEIKKLPDIQTKNVILGFLKNFKGIFNEKSLGEELLAVHNAGRYTSGSTVQTDLLPISITLMDDIAQTTLREANSAVEQRIDTILVNNNYARRIPIFDELQLGNGTNDRNSLFTTITQNYFFGKRSTEIHDPLQCTVSRGANDTVREFGRSQFVEANVAFDISKTESQIATLQKDTALLVSMGQPGCFPNNKPRIDSYWGGNTILRIAGSSADPASVLDIFPTPTQFTGFTAPIFSLGGMKESDRITVGSVNDCMSDQYQYTLNPARVMTYDPTPAFALDGSNIVKVGTTCSTAYPSEWTKSAFPGLCTLPRVVLGGESAPRYTCISNLTPSNVIPDFASMVAEYSANTPGDCITGKLSLDTTSLVTKSNFCSITDALGDTIDTTQYKNVVFHTIPSLYHHLSPTDEEISAAEANTVTPSLPIDLVRYVEFLTPKGNIARIHYPNFFDIRADDISSARAWISEQARLEWQKIIDAEQLVVLTGPQIQANSYLSAGTIPSVPIDWNSSISDEMITKILQARKWLQPDISTKYKKGIESMLSYSHGSQGASSLVDVPPQIPSPSQEYEIAYLGLPGSFGADFSKKTDSKVLDDYETGRREIEGLNISDESIDTGFAESNNPASECGPPDGVPLQEWPSAIMCWIKAQFPPRILAGSCGPSTIGLDPPNSSPPLSPGVTIATDTGALTIFYAGSGLIPHLPRSSMQLRENISIDFSLQKNDTLLGVLPGTIAHLEILSGTAGGKKIDKGELQKYLTLAPSSVSVGDKGATFILSSEGTAANLTLRGYYTIPLPDGSEMRIDSIPFQVQITPEYYALSLGSSGAIIANIDVTSPTPVRLNIEKVLKDGTSVAYGDPLSIHIIDDIDGSTVYSGSSFRSNNDTLPTDITKKIGVYRLIVSDSQGITGEFTFAVESGGVSQVRITPVSSALVRGAHTLAMIRLLDRLGNPITPDLHSLKVEVSGGYIVDSSGEKRTSMSMDIMESQVPLLLGADEEGVLRVTATIDDSIMNSTELNIYNTARIVLMRDQNPQVGGKKVTTHIEIQNESGQKISGLSSVASWNFPEGAGSFSKDAITITDGISESFDYTPGTISGNHSLMIDIPGIGTVPDMMFTVFPGDPLYIDHIQDNKSIIFSLRDRYGNSTSSTLSGSLSRNFGVAENITFRDGHYSIPTQGGYYTMSAPGLTNNSVSYRDEAGVHTIRGIDTYTALIKGNEEKMQFAPDYNARYTVLAGGSFLREGEDILYNTIAGGSQSLAVSTVLDSPYREDVLFSISPGGSYQIGQSIASSIQTSLSLRENIPLLTVSDLTTHKQIARILYPMGGALLETCQKNQKENCDKKTKNPTIRLTLPVSSPLKTLPISDGITLKTDTSDLLSVYTNGGISMSSDITLVPRNTGITGLEMIVMQGGREIASLDYIMDMNQSVQRSVDNTSGVFQNTPVILSSGFSIEPTSGDTLSSESLGYKIVGSTGTQELDESRNGPSHTDSLGALSEIPGVGWMGNNTMLLAYAAGDTVGEASRFFHTYTLINMGDPVAHIDHGKKDTEIDGVDRTVGSIIARGTERGISDFFHRDMDADGMEDLLVVYDDGYIELFLNRGGKFRSRGMITYNRDINSKKISFGDFSHDGYGDIIGLNKDGSLILIDNTLRKFSRRDITLEGGAVVPKNIGQLKIKDMDADGRDDIVYITSGGELGILYGTINPGSFIKKILDPTLGIVLSTMPIVVGGAIKSDQTPQFKGSLAPSSATPTTSITDEGMLKAEAFYQYSKSNISPSGVSVSSNAVGTVFTDIENGEIGNKVDTYVRSQYAPAYGLEIDKKYTNSTHSTIYPDDRITTTVRIHNATNNVIRNTEYLDTLPKIFSSKNTRKYSIKKGGTMVSRDFEMIGDNEYDAHFVIGDISPGDTIEISYDLTALPASYGEMIIGDLEKGTVGADSYGDVGFKTSTTCGAEMLLWTSGPAPRDYTRGTHAFGSVSLPVGIASRLTDSNKNQIPDSVENMTLVDRQKAYTNMTRSTKENRSLIKVDQSSTQLNIGFDAQASNEILTTTQNLMDGLACGFGGGSCMSFPLNWAPLAPGSDPVLFGNPIGDGLKTDEGLPIFSALTTMYTPYGPYPAIWPPFPSGAGGMFGESAPYSSFLRIFVTPTLTLGMGTAICMGTYPSVVGNLPPPAFSPLVQGGNCIVIAKPMNVCKGDGSSGDGDVSAVSGLGTLSDTWNAMSCQPQANTLSEVENKGLTNSIVNYLKSPDTTRLTSIYTSISRRGSRLNSGQPLLTIGSPSSGGSEFSIEVDPDTKLLDISAVTKIKNKRIAAFPDFVMEWLTRQTEELTTSLFTPPNLTIIPPTDFGQNAHVDTTYTDFSKKLGEAYSSANLENIQQGMSQAFDSKQADTTPIPDAFKSTISNTKGTLNSLKAAYTLIGKLPFITVRQVNIPLNIPWIDKRELDKYARSLNGYLRELEIAGKNFCITDPSATCLDQKAKIQSGPLINSIRQNLKRIEEYKKFPMKIQKYITWKERYIAQILCNINTIQQITSGWLRNNGLRFRKWAELFVLIKGIADSWQPLLDIFADTSASCGVCRNERNNLQYWKFKLISALIPSIPIIKFPKWPDIILDLSDIRFGINVALPNFVPRISPIRLPNLPNLSIGSVRASLTLPALPLLPPLPPLPDLPDLPSLPRIKLPDLPPPPKLPKIAGSISAFLGVMKLISKMYCYYQKTALVPEWQAGDVIAQRTERQGTSPFDFINLNLPQFTLPTLREIRVSSHVNYEIRSDFISEFARSVVRPINSFQTDMQMAIPSKIGSDVIIPSVQVNIKPSSYVPKNPDEVLPVRVATMLDTLTKEKDIFLEVGQFTQYLIGQLSTPEFAHNQFSLKKELRTTEIEAKTLQNELMSYNDKRFELIKDYIVAENDNTAHLQNIVDLLKKDIHDEPRQLISDIQEGTSRSTRLLEKFNNYQNSVGLRTDATVTSQQGGIDLSKRTLQQKVSNMIAATTSSFSSATEPVTSGYTPNYQGIYVRTPSGIQTRLFDYTSPVTPDTHIESIDIDQDGDTDYMYVLDGILYVKYSWLNTPNKIIDNTKKISDISANDLPPYVPDYFHSSISSPKNINFTFVPASSTETEWRLDFYDQYTEWDHVDIGDHNPQISPKTTIDISLKVPAIAALDEPAILTHAVRRSLASVGDQSSFILEGRSIDVYAGALSISLSAGRLLYTGDQSVTITYTNQTTSTPKTITLDPYTGYEFVESTEIITNGGQFYLIGGEDNSRYTYSDELIGLPILPGMRLYASDAGAQLRNHTTNQNIPLKDGATYITYDLGEKSDEYQISLPYSNGYYYARLQNLTDKKKDRAGVVLLAPQAASDNGAPILDIPSRLRLPIYSTKKYSIADILTDQSAVIMTIDGDTSTDDNGNGIFEDDFTTSGNGFSITSQDLSFGPFKEPGNHSMFLTATDEIGNTTSTPFTIESYALIPQIQRVTETGTIIGVLPEPIENTPVHFFRIRPGEGPILLSSGATLSNSGGAFVSNSFLRPSEIITLRNTTDFGTISNRGIMQLQSGYHSEVVPATSTDPMRILIMNESGSISHTHTISLPENTPFIDTSKASTPMTQGVLLTPRSGLTRIISASSKDGSIPGGVYVTDSTYHALAAVDRSGNIYSLDKNIILRYGSQRGSMDIELIQNGSVIADIEYRIDFFYTMQ